MEVLSEKDYVKLINYHLENGTNGIVPGGTTVSHQLYLITNTKK